MSYRVENKFVVSKDKIFDFKKWLEKNNFNKLYPKRIINSVYFDNKNFTIYKDSIEGTVPRKKIRIRTYSDDFFSIKNKFNFEIKVSSFEGRFKTTNIFNKNIIKIFSGIYDLQYGFCYPVLNVVYERNYFSNKKSRITIDSNIKYFKLNSKKISKFSSNENALVIENKSQNQKQNTMMNYFIFDNKRFSKYSSGIEKTQFINDFI